MMNKIYLVLYLKDIKNNRKKSNTINDKFKNMNDNLELKIDKLFALYEIIEEKAF